MRPSQILSSCSHWRARPRPEIIHGGYWREGKTERGGGWGEAGGNELRRANEEGRREGRVEGEVEGSRGTEGERWKRRRDTGNVGDKEMMEPGRKCQDMILDLFFQQINNLLFDEFILFILSPEPKQNHNFLDIILSK